MPGPAYPISARIPAGSFAAFESVIFPALAIAVLWTVLAPFSQAIAQTPSVTIFGARPTEATDSNASMLWLSPARSQTEIGASDLERWAPSRLEDLIGLIPSAVEEPLHAGLSTSIKLRGFAVSRVHYNGTPDIQRMFSRDLFTVEKVEVVRGPAAALLGVTSPGGAVNYVGKRPHGVAAITTVAAAAGNLGYARVTADRSDRAMTPVGEVRYRLIGAATDGRTPWAKLPKRRQTLMAVLERHYDQGWLGVDLQTQRNQSPFTFGTVITNGGAAGAPAQSANVAWDRELALNGGAPARRHYGDLRLRWKHRWDSGIELEAGVGSARVSRDETLIGYWTLVSPEAVSSYYTDYVDDYRQASGRIETRMKRPGWPGMHDLRLGVEAYRQQFLFEGVQNIGAIVTGLAAPDFSGVDAAAIALGPRYNDERIVENGAWIADRVTLAPGVDTSIAVRHQRYAIESDRTGAGRRPVAQSAALTGFVGVDWQLAHGWRTWGSCASGMEPNRGQTKSGGFLPQQESVQAEAGLAKSFGQQALVSVAVWRLGLRNVAMTDPTDRTAVVSAGQRKVEGVELGASARPMGWSFTGNLTLQRTRHVVKTHASLGDRFVGVPRASGGIQLSRMFQLPTGQRADFGLAALAVGSRMADAANTVRVPGFVRFDASAAVQFGAALFKFGARNLGGIRYVAAVTAVDDVFQGSPREWWAGIEVSL